jgi:alpha,alpha-trehalase
MDTPTIDRRDAERNEAKVAEVAPADSLSPADRYQELFVAVQCARLFDDSKTFVDCAPLRDPEAILDAYRATKAAPDFDLAAFVRNNFRPERPPKSRYVADPRRTLVQHIDYLWEILTRHPREHPTRSSLLPLPNPYVVPGGRFGEMYYWDSYFTMLGLADSGRFDLMRSMADNFAYLIDTFGHVPNGNRTYYLSRSQPPVFALMTELFEARGLCQAVRYLPRLRKEHAYWMEGADDLRRGEAHRHCVRMDDGALLNRYWDDRTTPREESYLEDVTTAAQGRRPVREVYGELRAGAASGWDYSSRWCDDGEGLATIRTTSILPVDLNSLLHKLEAQIAQLAVARGDDDCAAEFGRRAADRAQAIDRWLWDEPAGAYLDYDWRRGCPRKQLYASTVTPLFIGLASETQAKRVAAAVGAQLLEHGGLATSQRFTGEQWDQPNGWAPLQWMAIQGFAAYGETALSGEIARRWLDTVASLFRRERKLVEKYALEPAPEGARGGGGGEYPLQDGFGWTNGVTRCLLEQSARQGDAHLS